MHWHIFLSSQAGICCHFVTKASLDGMPLQWHVPTIVSHLLTEERCFQILDTSNLCNTR